MKSVPGTILTTTILAVLAAQCVPAATSDGADVLKAEDDFRLAKIHNDTETLDRLTSDSFIGVNHWGNRRDKAAMIELFRTFKTDSLEQSDVIVKISGDVATVDGAAAESGPGGKFSYLFVRVWVRQNGRWQLLSNAQLIPGKP
jgi:hypothetical protein